MRTYVLILGLILSFKATAWEDCGTDRHNNIANCEYQIIDGTLILRGTNGIGNIGDWANVNTPWRNQSIQNIVIESSIKDLGGQGFAYITSDKIEIPYGITNISFDAFKWVQTREVIVPETVTRIDALAFAGSTIEKLVIPDCVESIGTAALYATTNLTTLVIGDHTSLGSIFSYDGSMADTTNLKIYCSGDTAKCDANLEAAGYPEFKSIKATTKKINGVAYIYDTSGKLITTSGKRKEKRIYTLDEANAVTKPTGNTVRIKYR